MSHDHNDNDPQALYEGDQSKLYSGLMSHHDDIKSPESKAQVKRLMKVLVLLSIVTVVEVGLGLMFSYTMPRGILNTIFLVLTMVKAAYIVSVFMHLGDEMKTFFWLVLMPLLLFVWFIIAFLFDGGFWLNMNLTAPVR
ncbi:MAG: cytochrome C oxidase subunit IV family protein [Chitinophagales bacterium]|nr:cytochrome C oxidase subunit IV family protein [Chitinophagaceae bacterium]MCB9064446.1 cytochrome C oxidase subunit IV family protein [Chitinophagales bacterium]